MTRILIAEPSKTLAALIKLSLGELGAELEVTHDGAAALAVARQRLPDALVTDQALSGLDGYALAHAVKALAAERGRIVPTLLLVSEHAPPDAERMAYVGIGDVLPKPFERAVLLERVRALLDVRPQPATNLSYERVTNVPAPAPQISTEDISTVLAQKLPTLVDAALARMLPERLQQIADKALAERVPGLVEAAVRRALGELATPTIIQRIVAEDSRGVMTETAQRIEGRLENELLERLDRFAKEVLPQRLQAHAEQVIWKIVPTIAEDIVKDEIKRLTQEHP